MIASTECIHVMGRAIGVGGLLYRALGDAVQDLVAGREDLVDHRGPLEGRRPALQTEGSRLHFHVACEPQTVG